MAEENLDLDEDFLDGEQAPVTEPIPKTPETNKRTLIYAAIAAVIILVTILLAVSNLGGDKKSKASGQSSDIMVNKKAVAKEKKRRKKIKYIKMFNQLEGGETSKILKQLSLAGLHFKTDQVGQKYSVLVDEQQLDVARNLLAIKGLPSGSFKKGFELLDDAQTLGVTEFDKRIRFLRALSGELEKAITQMDMIDSAKVQIVLPEQRLFAITQPPVTSSIIIRLIEDYDISDEIIFSIIQLVSNAVENLQPENVSVIDTSGSLLSDGLFERLAAKRAGIFVEEDIKKAPIVAAISREEAIGTPIIPNYDRIQEWFEIKWEYEHNLKEKTERQLLGIMPLTSFKVELTADLGPLENGNIVDIKRQTISVVVDGLNEDVIIDKNLKQQVFSTVAGAVGYVRGRDSIQLSIAEFAIYTEEEKQALKEKYAQKSVLRMMLWVLLIGACVGGLLWGWKAIMALFKKEKEDKEITLEDELEPLEDIDSPIKTNEEKIAEIKQQAESSPQVLASIIDQWEKESKPEEEKTEEIAEEEVLI